MEEQKIALQVLSVGTKILTKDVMDQYLRSLGDIKTFYGSKLNFAISTFNEKKIDLVFCEMNFGDSSAQYFLKKIGGIGALKEYYFVIASEETNAEYERLRMELGVDAVMVKPFNAEKIKKIVDEAWQKKQQVKFAWLTELRQAKRAESEKRYVEAETIYLKCGRSYSDNPIVLVELADYLIAKNKLEKAEAVLHKLLGIVPDDLRAMWLMGLLERKKGNFTAALRFLKDAQDLSPLNQLRVQDIAETNFYQAGAESRRATILDEFYSDAILTHGKSLCVTAQYAACIQYLEVQMGKLSVEQKNIAEAYIELAKKLGNIA